MGADHQGSGYHAAIAALASSSTTMHDRLPKNSCDSHLHVFADARNYPANNPHALYRPPQDCNFEALKSLHDAMGIERAVFVQPTIYGTDHSLLHDVLKTAPQGKYRGVAIVDDSVSDAELERLNSVGVRGARFNFGGNFKLAPSLSGFRRGLDRVREIGWFVKIFGFGDDFLAVEAELRKIRSPAIIDHLGGPDYRRGKSQPAVRLILDLLSNDNWWIGLQTATCVHNSRIRGTTRQSSAACTTKPRRTVACGAPTGRTCIVSSGLTRTDSRTTASITNSNALHCSHAMSPIGRRATASWSTTRQGFSVLTEFNPPSAPATSVRRWCRKCAARPLRRGECAAHARVQRPPAPTWRGWLA